MFSASLSRAENKDVRNARKMAEIERRAKSKFRKTAMDPDRVRKQLEMRKNGGGNSLQNKKFLKNKLQKALLKDHGAVSALAIHDKKLRSRKLLYGTTGEEVCVCVCVCVSVSVSVVCVCVTAGIIFVMGSSVIHSDSVAMQSIHLVPSVQVEYNPGDRVQLGDWAEFHSSFKYNGSVGVVVETVDAGNADDVSITDMKTRRSFARYAVRVPFVKVRACVRACPPVNHSYLRYAGSC